MKVKAHAKINLALDVIRKREDGYHDLEMIMVPITLHDLIYIDVIEKGIEITANTMRVPTDEKNIMYKVADALMKKYNIKKGVRIHIYKHIPTQAGLAGGSADGAAVLRAMNSLFHLNLSLEKLAEIGKTIGADIPFCIYEESAVVRGIGEQLDFISNNVDCHILLVKPSKGVSTKKAFESLNIENGIHPNIDDMREGIIKGDYQRLVENLGNTLEEPSLKIVPEIQEIKTRLLELGFDGMLMSGSGSCVFGLTQNEELLNKGADSFKKDHYFVRKTNILKK